MRDPRQSGGRPVWVDRHRPRTDYAPAPARPATRFTPVRETAAASWSASEPDLGTGLGIHLSDWPDRLTCRAPSGTAAGPALDGSAPVTHPAVPGPAPSLRCSSTLPRWPPQDTLLICGLTGLQVWPPSVLWSSSGAAAPVRARRTEHKTTGTRQK